MYYIVRYALIYHQHSTIIKIIKDYRVPPVRRAKLGQIQGGLQRAIQDSTKGGLQYFFTFYALKIELFGVFTLRD